MLWRRRSGSAWELEAKETGLELSGLNEDDALPLSKAVENFLKDIQTFRKPLTHKKYESILQLFTEYAAPKSDARHITTEDIKKFIAWRKSKGFDPGTTLYTDRVILHNFFNKLGIDNPVKKVPRLPKFRKRPVAYTDAELKKFFGVCDDWERAFFLLSARDRVTAGRTPDALLAGPGSGASARPRPGKTPIWIFCRKIGKNAPSHSPRK